LKKRKIFFRGGEAVVEPWEDELLPDDDFPDEEEAAEEQIEEPDLETDEDVFADWEDASDGALEDALAEERALELECELEQDEHPRDYNVELEDEEEEAAPTSEKRLKREILAEALKRTEDSARTLADFQKVVEEWNRLDRNRERRERDHENLRGDVPLEFQAVPDPKIAPLWMNLPRFRQLCQGNFLDIIFSCPYELHELTANRFLSRLFLSLSDEQKEVLYYLFIRQYSTARLAAIRGQSDRNIRKLRMTVQKKLQKQMYEHLSEKQENNHGLTLREREFMKEYGALLQSMDKDAVIRRENKTKPRKKKNALDDDKDG
jgi:DNA-directed RNA polymerase specialized sigma24 family protein